MSARACIVCGADISHLYANAKVCCASCHYRLVTRRGKGEPVDDASHIRKCDRCGAPFLPHQHRQRFCSPACNLAWQAEAEKARRRIRRDASVEAGKLTDEQAAKVRADLLLEPAERFRASKTWTDAMRNYARRVYEQYAIGGGYV